MRKFKVGDRVITNLLPSAKTNYTLAESLFDPKSLRGTIKGTNNILKFQDEKGTLYAVELDDAVTGGHTCNDLCKDGHGWWFVETELKKEDN